MLKKFYAWLVCTDGVTGVEYAVLAGIIGGAVFSGTYVFGDSLNNVFDSLTVALDTADVSGVAAGGESAGGLSAGGMT